MRRSMPWLLTVLTLGVLWGGGCTPGGQPASDASFLPRSGELGQWELAGDVHTYDRDNLFDYMDGEAEGYFVYSFERLTVAEYVRGDEGPVMVELYRLGRSEDAYGLFTIYRTGRAMDIGRDGDWEPDGRLSFWQARYFVRVFAYGQLPQPEVLGDFGRSVAGKLPPGGDRPHLIGRLPQDGLVSGSAKYFHQKLTLDNVLWLGGENVLGLSPATDAVVADYDYSGQQVTLLLVQYPDAAQATAARTALEVARIEGLSATGEQGPTLAAVFNAGSRSVADELLRQALGEATGTQ